LYTDLQLVSQSSTSKTCKRYQKKDIFQSVTIFNKKLLCQCNLIARIEPVQDETLYQCFKFNSSLVRVPSFN